MKKLFIKIFYQLETDGWENIEFLSELVCEYRTEQLIYRWQQGPLTLFFCVVKPLYEQFFDWNCCVDIGSEGKIWKSVQNTAF